MHTHLVPEREPSGNGSATVSGFPTRRMMNVNPTEDRLRLAAERVIEAAIDGGFHHGQDWATVPGHLLRDLKRELDGEPQPSGLKFMSMSAS